MLQSTNYPASRDPFDIISAFFYYDNITPKLIYPFGLLFISPTKINTNRCSLATLSQFIITGQESLVVRRAGPEKATGFFNIH